MWKKTRSSPRATWTRSTRCRWRSTTRGWMTASSSCCLPQRPADLSRWDEIVRRIKAPRHRCRIGVVGKYIEIKDSYKSLYEALAHGGIAHEAAVEVAWVDAERIEREGLAGHVAGLDGILVPGGFGDRGIEGKIQAIRYAREQRVPYFGICLGMQC